MTDRPEEGAGTGNPPDQAPGVGNPPDQAPGVGNPPDQGPAGGRRVGRRARLALAAVAVLATVLAANVAAYGSTAQVDLSASRRFSLSSDSTSLARAVSGHLEITAFLSNVGGAARDARFLLDRYHQINRRITGRVVDPDANPGEAQRFGITRYATVVLTYRGRRVDAPTADELPLSTAILKLLRGTTPTLCYLTGHGEPSLTDTAPQGLSKFNRLASDNDYRIQPLDLTTGSGAVPGECAAVLVVAPVDPLLPAELTTLADWARAGGKLMVLGSPLTRGDPNPLLSPWGIHYAGGLVLDPARDQGLDQSNVIVEDLPSASPVDDGVSRLQFPAGGGLVVDAGTRGGLTVERLAVTSNQSWVESRPDLETVFDAGDIPGPVTVAAAADASRLVSGPDPRLAATGAAATHIVRSRVFATGGDAWLTNGFLDNLGNRRLMVNALAWLTEQEQLVAATARPNDFRPLPLTPERRARILAITVGAVPGAIIGLGLVEGYVLRRRRVADTDRPRGGRSRPGRRRRTRR